MGKGCINHVDEGQLCIEHLCKLDADTNRMRGHRAFVHRDENSVETHLRLSDIVHPQQICTICSSSYRADTIQFLKSRRNSGTGYKPAQFRASLNASPTPRTFVPAWPFFRSVFLVPVTEHRSGKGHGPLGHGLLSGILIRRQATKQPETRKWGPQGCRSLPSG